MILGFVGFLLVRVCVTLGCLSTPLCGLNDTHPFHSKGPPLSDPLGVELAAELRMAAHPGVPLAGSEVHTHNS